MLHEVLLALSGHPSPLFSDKGSTDIPLLSPSEKALLQSIGRLSELHRKLREHVRQIAVHHTSTICRAVATSIQETHLPRFQDKIIDVESKILTKDASIVGAYDIVPLAGVVGEFEDWHRRMAWYWEIASFIQPAETKSASARASTGASVIDKLRMEQQTGYPDVEQAAVELGKIAELAWLRQLASWVLFGKLPKFGANDFFIREEHELATGESRFSKEKDLLPKFVTSNTALSILFIGTSIHQVERYGRRQNGLDGVRSASMPKHDISSAHRHLLSQVSFPIPPAQLSRSIAAIRLSLSQNVLKHLLPMELTLECLSCFHEFFLISRGDFAITLIGEAESRVQARQQSLGRLLDPVKALQGLSIKDAEFQQTLSATWKALASHDEDADDSVLDFARRHVFMSTPSGDSLRPPTSESVYGRMPDLSFVKFNDLLFPSSASLDLNITAPLDLFISSRDVEAYSTINAYLSAIRRARLRLSDLWRRTTARRDHSSPPGSQTAADAATSDTGSRIVQRRIATRKVWATCSATIFFVSEISAYFEGELIRESWSKFEKWFKSPASTDQLESTEMSSSVDPAEVQRDPETLAAGHRAFLASLAYALLLNDTPFTRELRSLLGNIDNLIAFFDRLLDLQQKLDLEKDAGGETGYTASEEQRISLELDRARKKVDSDLKSVVNRLRQLDRERIGAGRCLDTGASESGFAPWKGGGVDRLLMKLEFGRMTEDELDIV